MHEHNQDNQDLSVKLTAYLMGELEVSEAQEMERALAESAELRAEKAKLESVIGLVREHGAEEPSLSAAARESLLAEAEGGTTLSFYERPMTQRMANAASVLILVGGAGAIYLMNQFNSLTDAEVMELARAEGEASIKDSTPKEGKLLTQDNRSQESTPPAPVDRALAEAIAERMRALDGGVQEPVLRDSEISLAESPEIALNANLHAVPDTAWIPITGPGTPAPGAAKRKLNPGGGGGGGPATPGPNQSIGIGGGAGGKAAGRYGSRFGGRTNAAQGALTGSQNFYFESGRGRLVLGREARAFDSLEITGGLLEELDEGGIALGVGDEAEKDRTRELQRQQAQLHSQWIIDSCKAFPDEDPTAMYFRFWGDNPFVRAALDAQSTFGVDVDTASYTLARRYLSDGNLPEKAQIRTEEFVNYFKPDVDAPTEGVFRVHTELAPSRFGGPDDKMMLRVTVRGKDVAREERQPLNLTFVVDVSGSMNQNGRIETVKHGLRLLTAQLDANDSVALVAYSNQARVVLPMTSAASRAVIEEAIHGLQTGGGTNAEAGLMMGYAAASDQVTEGRHHRVVLLSDGVANIGQIDQDRINADIKKYRDRGIYLNTIGVGMNNHNDVFLEQLANKGDGICNYIDDDKEARRALVENFTGAFEPIARDVKIQVEFESAIVKRYRQLGYENRAIADADFRNDAVDAGEVGAGHQVTALYELELEPNASLVKAPLATVRLRWKEPTGAERDPLEDSATERQSYTTMSQAASWEGASYGFRRAACVAQFAEILRRSQHARTDSLDELLAESQRLEREHLAGTPGADDDFIEFLGLLERSRQVILNDFRNRTALDDCVRTLRDRRYRHHNCIVFQEEEGKVQELEVEIAELEAKVRELVEQESH